MGAFFSRFRISAKIMLGVGLYALLALFIAAFGITQLQRVADETANLVKDEARSVELAGTIAVEQNRVQQLWLFSVIENDRPDFDAFMEQVAESNARADAAIEAITPLLSESEAAADLTALKGAVAEYRRETAEIPPLWSARRMDEAQDVLQHGSKEAFANIRETTGSIVERERAALEAGAADAEATASSVTWTLIIVSALGLLLIGGLVWYLVRSQITKPLSVLTDRMAALASGDIKIQVEGTERKDEVGEMARALGVFRDNAQKQAATAAEMAKAEADQRLVTATLADSLAALRDGDLTKSITVEFWPAYAELKSNYNSAMEALRELIGSVMESTSAIRTGATEIAQASEDLARRTEGNAASLEQTSAAVTQMDDRLKATADASNRTVTRADGAIATVAGGRQTADAAVQAMGRVAESAKGIDSVIEGLDKIAFQTRVLAMNAAVEAGRAGEAGRGFAVVADLVSALAMRAEEEAGRARDQLTATQTDIVAAVDMVEKVDGALANIANDVSEVHQLLGEMAVDNQTQSAAITQISTAVATMDHSTQQNAAMVEETSAAARNLSSEVTVLADQASRFRVDTGTARTAAAARSKAPAAAVAKPRAAAPESAYKPSAGLLPSAHSGGTVDAGDWASF